MSDKLREAFERDVCKPRRLRTMKVIATGEYVDLSTSAALEAFQAGHAHAMRGEKAFKVECKVCEVWLSESFYPSRSDAEKEIALLQDDNPRCDFQVVVYIRQEEE